MITASTGEASIASRKAAKSASPYFVGRHIRGRWWKIWMDSQPRSVPRATAFGSPPPVETWAPISIGGVYCRTFRGPLDRRLDYSGVLSDFLLQNGGTSEACVPR